MGNEKIKKSDEYIFRKRTALPLIKRLFRCDFSSKDFQNSDFKNLTLTHFFFRSSKFQLAKINDSKIRSCVFIGCDFSGSFFTEAKIAKSTFVGCNFSRSNFFAVDVFDTQFISCNFTDADFAEAEFNRVNLTKSDLTNVNLNKTYMLNEVSLSGVSLPRNCESTDFSRCVLHYDGVRGIFPFFKLPVPLEWMGIDEFYEYVPVKHAFLFPVKATIASAKFYLLDKIRWVTWPFVASVGNLRILTKASYLSLVIVPLIAWCWPSIRGAINDYNDRVKGSIEILKEAEVVSEKLNSHSSVDTEELVALINNEILSIKESISRRVVKDANMPTTLLYAYLASLTIVIGHVIFEVKGPSLIKDESKEQFVQAKKKIYEEMGDKGNFKLKEALYHIKKNADMRQESYHLSLIPGHNGLQWINPDLDFDTCDPYLKLLIIEHGATVEYDFASHQSIFPALFAVLFYFAGAYLILRIIIQQTLNVIHQSGYTVAELLSHFSFF